MWPQKNLDMFMSQEAYFLCLLVFLDIAAKHKEKNQKNSGKYNDLFFHRENLLLRMSSSARIVENDSKESIGIVKKPNREM